MLDFYADDDDGEMIFGFYDVDGFSKKIVRCIREIYGYHFVSQGDSNDYFEPLPEFVNNTLIISAEHVNEDVIELARDKKFCLYIVATP